MARAAGQPGYQDQDRAGTIGVMVSGLGKRAEWLALALLRLKGYRLCHRNWHGPGGELDLVVQQHDLLVFVEVKSRTSTSFGGAAAAVDRAKRQRLVRTASVYLSRFGLWHRPCRFDVITLERGQSLLRWRLRHILNAFSADLGRQV